MTRAADRQLLADWKAGRFQTREAHLVAHVGTIDSAEEMSGFIDQARKAGAYTGDVQIAVLRRQKQIGASTHG